MLFKAVAEPRRREISNICAARRPVGEIVDSLGMGQPSVSNTCALAQVPGGCAQLMAAGCSTGTNAEAIRPLHEWTETFETVLASN